MWRWSSSLGRCWCVTQCASFLYDLFVPHSVSHIQFIFSFPGPITVCRLYICNNYVFLFFIGTQEKRLNPLKMIKLTCVCKKPMHQQGIMLLFNNRTDMLLSGITVNWMLHAETRFISLLFWTQQKRTGGVCFLEKRNQSH